MIDKLATYNMSPILVGTAFAILTGAWSGHKLIMVLSSDLTRCHIKLYYNMNNNNVNQVISTLCRIKIWSNK